MEILSDFNFSYKLSMLVMSTEDIIKNFNLYIFVTFILCGFLIQSPAFSEEDSLFTEDEAAQLRHNDKEWDKESVPKHKPDTLDRPSIIFEEPAVIDTDKGPTIEAIDPANVYIVIKQNASPLDPGTLQVWGEKFFVHIDVTDKVLKYFKLTKDGAKLRAKGIHIPKGHYKVGISIKDINGNKMEKKYRLKVE